MQIICIKHLVQSSVPCTVLVIITNYISYNKCLSCAFGKVGIAPGARINIRATLWIYTDHIQSTNPQTIIQKNNVPVSQTITQEPYFVILTVEMGKSYTLLRELIFIIMALHFIKSSSFVHPKSSQFSKTNKCYLSSYQIFSAKCQEQGNVEVRGLALYLKLLLFQIQLRSRDTKKWGQIIFKYQFAQDN